ncbi:hypothetical protein D3C87_619310 [compost metagenome]
MRMVELGGDVDGQLLLFESLDDQRAVGCRAHEIAAERDEGLSLALQHRGDGFHGIVAGSARHRGAEFLLQRVEKRRRCFFVDADGAVTLHVGMAAHRAKASAGTADIAAQQHEIGDFSNDDDGVTVLGDAHGPCGDDRAGIHVDTGGFLDLRAGEAGLVEDAFPARRFDGGAIGLELCRMFGDEVVIDDGRLAHRPCGLVGGKDRLAHAAHRRHVAALARLVIIGGNASAAAGNHLDLVLWVGETLQTLFPDGIEDGDPGAAKGGAAQVAQHAGMVGAGILPDDENGVGLLEILKQHGALADADRFLQADAARFVAHVGAVGEIIGAVEPDHQLIEEGGLVGGAAGGIELRPVRAVETVEDVTDFGEGIVPGNGQISVACPVITHGMGEAALFFQIVVRPAAQFGDGAAGEEIRWHPGFRRLP